MEDLDLNPLHPEFEPEVECGASVAPEGSSWARSFGGYLIDQETKIIYGLTCAYNFCRYDAASKDKTAEEMVEFLPGGTRVLQLALIDRKFGIDQLEENMIGDALRRRSVGNFEK